MSDKTFNPLNEQLDYYAGLEKELASLREQLHRLRNQLKIEIDANETVRKQLQQKEDENRDGYQAND